MMVSVRMHVLCVCVCVCVCACVCVCVCVYIVCMDVCVCRCVSVLSLASFMPIHTFTFPSNNVCMYIAVQLSYM